MQMKSLTIHLTLIRLLACSLSVYVASSKFVATVKSLIHSYPHVMIIELLVCISSHSQGVLYSMQVHIVIVFLYRRAMFTFSYSEQSSVAMTSEGSTSQYLTYVSSLHEEHFSLHGLGRKF